MIFYRKINILFISILGILLSLSRPCYAVSNGDGLMMAGGLGVVGAALAIVLSQSGKDDAAPTPAPEDHIITDHSIFFNEPGTKNISLSNPTERPITINTVTLSDTIYGITVGDYSSCQPIPAGGKCKIPLTANAYAYGSGDIYIAYGKDNKKVTASVGVANTQLSITPLSKNNNIYIEPSTIYPLVFKNSGNFDARGTEVCWKTPLPTGLTIYNDTCSNHTIPPNGTCSVEIKTKKGTQGKNAELENKGANVKKDENNIIVTGDWTITLNKNINNLHLGYRPIEISNTTNNSLLIKNINVQIDSNLTSKIKYCSSVNDTDCYYPKKSVATNCEPDSTLSSNGSCLIWFKALDDNMDLNKTSGNLNIEVTTDSASNPTKSQTFSVTYMKALYVGGNFDTAGGKTAQRIAIWDGTDWSALGNSTSTGDEVFAFAVMTNSDIYIGGDFLAFDGLSAPYLASWNGFNWSSLGSGTNGPIYTLAYSDTNDALYIGGAFTSAGGGTRINNITKWNGLYFEKLGVGTNADVYAINSTNNDLYVGGHFTEAGNKPGTNYIANWNGSEWSELAGGTNGPVFAITKMDNYLYIGGSFASAGEAWRIHNTAYWNGTSWDAMGKYITYGAGTDDNVYALTNMNNEIYVGGKFSSAGNEPGTKHIASYGNYYFPLIWSWSALYGGQGTNGDVYAFTNTGNNLYIGGQFTSVIGIGDPINYIAKWNKETGWSPLCSGVLLSGNPDATVVKSLTVTTSIMFIAIP